MARARFLARRRRSRHWTAGAPGSASPRCNSRVMTRTASDNSVLSLGSCIRAEVTVLSSPTVAPLSSRSCLALANKAWLIASQVTARIAAIVWCSTDFFGDHCNGRRAKARNEAESSRHEIGCELKAMSQWLDGQRQLTSLVAG